VKAQSDIVAVDALIEQRTIDKEFAADVLAVDFTNPVFSASRCGLLKFVPNDGGSSFVSRFQDALRGASVPGAVELLGNLTDPQRHAAWGISWKIQAVSSSRPHSLRPRPGV
jgi:hypothetical protein